MLLQLLWIEVVVKAVAGGLLSLFPRTLARVLGLPAPVETLWPRLLGATLLGLSAATVLEVQLATKNGIGLAGHVALNFSAALMILALLILGKASGVRRGRVILGLAAAGLIVLAMLELAYS